MALEVIGAGFGRTGTLSLKLALEQLGFGRCYHMSEAFAHPDHVPFWEAATRGEVIDWDVLFVGYRSTTDWPAATFWAELAERYPEAKVILTVRDPERWYDSVRATIFRLGRNPMVRYLLPLLGLVAQRPRAMVRMGRVAEELIWEGTFGGGFEDRTHAIAAFERHNASVMTAVPAERLLVFDVREGWEPLCDFLEVEVPERPFPRVNDRASMRRTVLSTLIRRRSAPVEPD